MSETPQPMPGPELSSNPGRRRRLVLFGVICLLNALLLIVLVTQLLTPASQANTDPLIGHPAPAFTLPLLSSQEHANTLTLASLRGKPLVINFWASWCDPCKEEAPLLEKNWEALHAQGKDVVFLGIDFQETSASALSFLQAYHITYPLALDAHGAVSNTYTIHSLPDTLFIKRDGTVASKVAQQINAALLASNLRLITD